MSASGSRHDGRATIILAGGDGTRLRSLTRRITGRETPKQFCPLIGKRTLLEQTRDRAALIAPSDINLTVLTREHERFYAPILADTRADGQVVQPINRGTAPAILYALMRVANANPNATVAILPSDHYISNNQKFAEQLELAFDTARARPELTTLVGITPTHPEAAYGWIEVGPALGEDVPGVFRASRFWEKPSPETAQILFGRGCLWNSFVMVARVSTLLGLFIVAAPSLYVAFAQIRSKLGTPFEARAVGALYSGIQPVSFSDQILERTTYNLAVLPVSGFDWSDLGEPRRVMDVLSRLGISLRWMAA